jgi:RNA polymerase subunit RPABC4/transcription elongation factor Spt4
MKVSDKKIIEVCKSSLSMSSAASTLGIHFNTLKKRAILLGVYNTNPSGKGLKKPKGIGKGGIVLSEILEGKHPQYQTNKLRKRLIKENIKDERCEVCGIEEWNGKLVSFELDHINGVRNDHRINNLRIICPNCHSQTHTYRSRNIK